jgi:hypothetical protein
MHASLVKSVFMRPLPQGRGGMTVFQASTVLGSTIQEKNTQKAGSTISEELNLRTMFNNYLFVNFTYIEDAKRTPDMNITLYCSVRSVFGAIACKTIWIMNAPPVCENPTSRSSELRMHHDRLQTH